MSDPLARTPEEAEEDYVRGVKALLNDLVKRLPGDASIARLQKRVVIAAAEMPHMVVKKSGPYLLKYQAVIFSDDFQEQKKFFEGDAIDREIEAAQTAGKGDEAAELIPKVQKLVRDLPASDQKLYIQQVQDLLDAYLEWME